MTHWTSDANQEMQADEFAGHLLMPLTHFREGLGDGAVDINQLGDKSDVFGVSLTAAALRWVKSTPSSAVFVVSRDGFMDWAVPSERALKNGAYFKTKSNVCEIPAASVTASGITQKTPHTVAASTWFPNADRAATLQEMTVVCGQPVPVSGLANQLRLKQLLQQRLSHLELCGRARRNVHTRRARDMWRDALLSGAKRRK